MSTPQLLTCANLAQIESEDLTSSVQSDQVMHKATASDDGSGSDSDSDTTANSTSTYQYSHEPYATFEGKVQILAESVGSFQTVELKRIRGGANNRVVIAHFQAEFTTASGIFRIPRSPQFEWQPEEPTQAGATAEADKETAPLNQRALKSAAEDVNNLVAVHHFLKTHGISAPDILAFDTTDKNPIKLPYALLKLSEGVKLHDIYDELPLAAKKKVVDELTDFLVLAENISFPKVGTLSASLQADMPAAWSGFTDPAFAAPAVEVVGFAVDACPAHGYVPATQDLANFLTDQIEASRQLKLKVHGEDWIEPWDYMRDVVKEMVKTGYLRTAYTPVQRNVLHHWDLESYNILVKHDASIAEPTIAFDSIIDWDDVRSVPSILTRKPPAWLWDADAEDFVVNAGSREYALTADDESSEFYVTGAGAQRIGDTDRAIKQYFEETFVRKMTAIYPEYSHEIYMDEAYGKGAFIRRFARFAIDGIGSSWEEDRLKRFLKEWFVELDKFKLAAKQPPAKRSWHSRVKSVMRSMLKKAVALFKQIFQRLKCARRP